MSLLDDCSIAQTEQRSHKNKTIIDRLSFFLCTSPLLKYIQILFHLRKKIIDVLCTHASKHREVLTYGPTSAILRAYN